MNDVALLDKTENPSVKIELQCIIYSMKSRIRILCVVSTIQSSLIVIAAF